MAFDLNRFNRLFHEEGMSYDRGDQALTIVRDGRLLYHLPINELSNIEDFDAVVDQVRNIHHQGAIHASEVLRPVRRDTWWNSLASECNWPLLWKVVVIGTVTLFITLLIIRSQA